MTYSIVATPAELDARDGWWKWEPTTTPRANENSADKWLRPAGYLAEEVKRALRRSPVPPKAKRDRGGHYKPQDYRLPLPSLAASSKRLAGASLRIYEWDAQRAKDVYVDEYTGPRAAERYVAYRRTELGLSNEWDA